MRNSLASLLRRSPLASPPGAGMSTRPEFYSGRGVAFYDLGVKHLRIIQNGLTEGEASGEFPAGAVENFRKMVADIPVLTASCFLENLHILDQLEFKWDKTRMHGGGFSIGADDATGSRELAALSGLISLFSGVSDPEEDRRQTRRMKLEFGGKSFISEEGAGDSDNEGLSNQGSHEVALRASKYLCYWP